MKKDKIGLYVILDRTQAKGRDLSYVMDILLGEGVEWIQLREKDMEMKEFYHLAYQLNENALKAKANFIINDRLDLALALEGAGVHVGQDDMPALVTRKIIGEGRLMGVSSHRWEESIKAERDGADYVAIGPVFPTNTKVLKYDFLGVDVISKVRKLVSKPLVAIGGINQSNVQDIIRAGADGVAVISAIMSAPDIAFAVRTFQHLISDARQ